MIELRKFRCRFRRLAVGWLMLIAISIASADTALDRFTQPRQNRESSGQATEIYFSREQWHLTETEWQRYSILMQGIRGSISPKTVSPIEVLGVHARNETERSKYAKLWANLMREDAERILAFQAAYNAAWRELNPSGEIIDVDNLPRSNINENAIQAGDRVLLFLRLNDCPECQALYTRVRRAAHEVDAQFDIYFTDTQPNQDDPVLLKWIAQNRFDRDRLKRQKITFNHDNGALQRTGGPNVHAPAAYRIRNQLIDPLEIGMPGL